MIREWIKNKKRICLLGAAILVAAACLAMTVGAKEDSFVSWDGASKSNEVAVSLRLQDKEELEDVETFQVNFILEGDDIDKVEFTFDSGLKDNEEIPVKKAFYENGILSVYVSGRETVLGRASLKLGKIKVESDSDVTISFDSCKTVDRFHTSGEIEYPGDDLLPYTMELSVPKEPEDPSDKPVGPTEDPEDPTEETTKKPEEPTGTAEEPTEETTEEPEDTTEAPEEQETRDHGSSSGRAPANTPGRWNKGGDNWTFMKLDGTLAKNEWVGVNGTWYWMDENGHMKTGWIHQQGTWYFCDSTGAMRTGWVSDQGTWYYCDYSGAMKTGWISDHTYWYYLNDNGSMKTGWLEKDGKWYYLEPDGKMAANTVTPDGYQLDRNGVWVK